MLMLPGNETSRMDIWMWTLRCQGCGKSFEIELKPGESVIEHAKVSACPYCHAKPDGTAFPPWHHVIRYRKINRD